MKTKFSQLLTFISGKSRYRIIEIVSRRFNAIITSIQPYFFVVRAEVFHGIPEKNRDFAIQFFVQTIFHFSTSLHRPLVLNTIGEL